MTNEQKKYQRIDNCIYKIQQAYNELRANIRTLKNEDNKDYLLDESGQISIAIERLEEKTNKELNKLDN